jgi:hypothetical protein
MENGYIKLYRSSLKKGWLQNPKLWAFWCWCLMKASHREHKQIVGHQVVDLLPGQLVFGLKAASKELRQSIQSIRTHLKFCTKVEQNLTVKTTNKYSIITIVNWDSYQVDEEQPNKQNNNQLTNKQQTTNKQLTTNKNGKNGKKEKKDNKPLTFWPEDLTLTDHLRQLASKYIPADKIDDEWIAFKAWALSKNIQSANWQASWTTRYINYAKFNQAARPKTETGKEADLLREFD